MYTRSLYLFVEFYLFLVENVAYLFELCYTVFSSSVLFGFIGSIGYREIFDR